MSGAYIIYKENYKRKKRTCYGMEKRVILKTVLLRQNAEGSLSDERRRLEIVGREVLRSKDLRMTQVGRPKNNS